MISCNIAKISFILCILFVFACVGCFIFGKSNEGAIVGWTALALLGVSVLSGIICAVNSQQ